MSGGGLQQLRFSSEVDVLLENGGTVLDRIAYGHGFRVAGQQHGSGLILLSGITDARRGNQQQCYTRGYLHGLLLLELKLTRVARGAAAPIQEIARSIQKDQLVECASSHSESQ